MASKQFRKIVVNNQTYLWNRAHYHLVEYKHSACIETVVVYLEGYKNSPMRVSFREEDNLDIYTNIKDEKWCVGYPRSGVIWFSGQKNIDINLNRPAVVAKLIKYFTKTQWKPMERTKPLIIDNALTLLDQLDLPQGL